MVLKIYCKLKGCANKFLLLEPGFVFVCNQCWDRVTLPGAGTLPVLKTASFAAATALLCKVAVLI